MRQFVRYHADIPVSLQFESTQHEFMLQNVSLGGMACIGETEIPKGSTVTVNFDLLRPEYVSEEKVIWCRPFNDEDGRQIYELGLEHLGERDRSRLVMVEQISHIEHYRNEIKLSEGRDLSGAEAAREWIDKHVESI